MVILQKVAELRTIENPHLKDDEFDLIDMIKIEGYLIELFILFKS
jgi:hypothetical protein